MSAEEGPVTQTIEASDTQKAWDDVFERVSRHAARVLVEQHGEPKVAIISADDFRRFSRMEALRAERFALVAKMREAFGDVPQEQREREVAQVEKRGRRSAPRSKRHRRRVHDHGGLGCEYTRVRRDRPSAEHHSKSD